MRRPRKFFHLIVILLVINVSFFTIWYAFGGRNLFRSYLAKTIGKAIHADLSIGDLHISDRQLYAENIHFALPDSLLTLDVQSLRVRYRLYKFIFSGFNPENIIGSVEIERPVASLNYHYRPKAPKPRGEPFRLPDLTPYFKSVTIRNGSFSTDLAFPVRIFHKTELRIEETLNQINLSIVNDTSTKVKLMATSTMGGSFSIDGTLNDGLITVANADIQNYKPLYAYHRDVQDFRSEISVVGTFSQASQKEVSYSGKAILWNTSGLLYEKYKASIPYIYAETDGTDLWGSIKKASLDNSSIEAEIRLNNFTSKKLSFDGSSAQANIDLGMILPQLSGRVAANVSAKGTIKEPELTLTATSAQVAYNTWQLNNIAVKAAYQDDTATAELRGANWQNQSIDLNASYQPYTRELIADISTQSHGKSWITADGTISLSGLLIAPYPMLNANFKDVDVEFAGAAAKAINGYAHLYPTLDSYYIDCDLSSSSGFALNVVGDLLDQNLVLNADFKDLVIDNIYPNKALQRIAPTVSGSVSAIMNGSKIWTDSRLDLSLNGEWNYRSKLDLLGSFDIKNIAASSSIRAYDGFLNDKPLAFELFAEYHDKEIAVKGLRLNDAVNLSGSIDLQDWQDMDFSLSIDNLKHRDIIQYFPDLEFMVPEFANLKLFAEYNQLGSHDLSVWLNMQELDLISVVPINLDLLMAGNPENVLVDGQIGSAIGKMVDLSGSFSLLPNLNLALSAAIAEMKLENILIQPPGKGTFGGTVNLMYDDILGPKPEMELGLDVKASGVVIGDFSIDEATIQAAQEAQVLKIDSLYVHSQDLFTASAKGALDYNVFSREFFEGTQEIQLSVEGELFRWLKSLSPYIVESRGKSSLNLNVSTLDEQFLIKSGSLDINRGYLHLKDQVEPIRHLELKGIFDNNRFMLQRGQFTLGNGKMILSNLFDPDPSDHFVLGFLDLGYFRLLIEEPGIQASLPVISPPKTMSNIALKGQTSRYATVKGPFDDMKIAAHVTASNTDILFPPGADNLLNLIMSVRNTAKKPESDPVPLPFTLDLLVTIGEGVRYVTYPTNISLQPGGFLHLIYDGNAFIVDEALLVSDRGSIDFFGTIFQVDNITITMIDQQNVLNVDGNFYRRTPDGSTIRLTVTSTPDFDKSFFDRLQLNLFSDNPNDRNITQVLSRLRYNQSMDDLPEDQKQNLLQDEALGLIGGNLNSTVLTPFFYPVENWVRRSLKLDSFSINAGFIENLFTEYSSDPSQLAELTDMKHFASDITAFSSSILLNNLSVSMSKYVGYRMFVDYEFMLQEATDLQQKSRILLSHDTTLRMNLPRQFRIGYSFKYSPKQDGISHEILLQKSWRFWGL